MATGSDLPGLVVQGTTRAEAIELAQVNARLLVEAYLSKNLPLPPAIRRAAEKGAVGSHSRADCDSGTRMRRLAALKYRDAARYLRLRGFEFLRQGKGRRNLDQPANWQAYDGSVPSWRRSAWHVAGNHCADRIDYRGITKLTETLFEVLDTRHSSLP